MKKIVTTLLICMMIFTSTINVFADYSSGTFHYIIENDEIVITNCFGHDSIVEIPEMIAGRTVTKIAAGAFTDNSYVTKIIVPVTVSVIEPDAIKSGITVEFLSTTGNPPEEIKPPVTSPVIPPAEEPENTVVAPDIVSKDILPSKTQTVVIAPQIGEEKEEQNNNQTDNFEVNVEEDEIVLEDDDFVEDNSKKDHKLIYFIASVGVLLILVVIAIIKLVK